jgi:hypothetical protein
MDEFWNAIKEDLDDDLENFWVLEYILVLAKQSLTE